MARFALHLREVRFASPVEPAETATRTDPADVEAARRSLSGRLEADPRDALAWAQLARVEYRFGDLGTARLCAEAAASLEPGNARIRLARAEVLAASAEWGERGRHELAELAGASGPGGTLGKRAQAILRALGPRAR
jgi:tetratricopeptide (TPR) repeat protein